MDSTGAQIQLSLLQRAGVGGTSDAYRPVVRIDGQPVSTPLIWGANTIETTAGRHVLDVEVRYGSTFGRASLPVDVPEGEVVPVFYAKPQWRFLPGAIGLKPQQAPTAPWLWIVLVLGAAFAIGLPLLLAVLG